LKNRYGGEWALLTDGTDATTRKLAIELAREGYNLIFIVRKEGKEEKITTSTSKYGVKVEFIIADNYLHMGSVCEDALKDKDLSIVVTGLPENLIGQHIKEQDAFASSFSQQLFLSGVVLPRLLVHHELTGKKGALIHVLSNTASSVTHSPQHPGQSSPERSPSHNHIYAAWSRSFNFTYGLGLTEQYRDQVDVLTAVKPTPQFVEASDLSKSEFNESKVT